MTRRILSIMLIALSLMSLAAQASHEEDALTVYCYDSFSGDWGPAGKLIPMFEEKTGIKVNLVSAGDAVEMLSRLELEGDDTEADIILGISDDFAYRAYPYLESYDSEYLADIPEELVFDKEHRLLPFDYGAFAFVYDSESGIERPETLADLTKPEYEGKVILIDPRTSSVGLGLLFWTYNLYGEDYMGWWLKMKENALTITDGWSSAYGLFTEGEAPIVLSYTTSPVYHVMNENTTRFEALIFPEGHEATIEGIGIVRGTDRRAEAEAFIDFMLTDGQLDTAIANSMYPANDSIALPPAFDYAPKPDIIFQSSGISLDQRENIIDIWAEEMSR